MIRRISFLNPRRIAFFLKNFFKNLNLKKWLKNILESVPTWTSLGYWLKYYRHRIIRLWPAYIYVMVDVGMRSSLQHFHPMWPPTDPAVQCPKHWWKNVLFINSLTENRCMPWTW